MKQIIPFKKELPFRTKVSEITSISLERDIDIKNEGIISGKFYITGDYKMNEGSINREDFSFELPFDITLDPRYDVSTVSSDIEDFYYDVINEDTLKVNIDLFVEAEYKVEDKVEDEIEDKPEELPIKEDNILDRKEDFIKEKEEDTEVTEDTDLKKEFIPSFIDAKDKNIDISDKERDYTKDLFSNLDDTETFTTYYIYIVKEEDTIDKIMNKYEVSKEDIEAYNDITSINVGDKIIIPKRNE